MADKILTAVDKRTGARVKFHWTGSGVPQKEDLDQIFAEQHDKAKEAVNNAGTKFDTQHPGATDVGPVGTIGDIAERGLTRFGQAFGVNREAPPSTDNRSLYQRAKDYVGEKTSEIGFGSTHPSTENPFPRGQTSNSPSFLGDIKSGNYAGAAGTALGYGIQAAPLAEMARGGLRARAVAPQPAEAPTTSARPMAAPAPPKGQQMPPGRPVSSPIIDAEFEDITPNAQPNQPGISPTTTGQIAPPAQAQLPPVQPRQVSAPPQVPQIASAEASPNFYQGGASTIPPVEAPVGPVAPPVAPETPPPATLEPIKLPRRGSKTPIGNPPVETPPTATVVPENLPQAPEPPPFEARPVLPPTTIQSENYPDWRPADVAPPQPVTVNYNNIPREVSPPPGNGTAYGRPVQMNERNEPVMYADEPPPGTQIDPTTPPMAGSVPLKPEAKIPGNPTLEVPSKEAGLSEAPLAGSVASPNLPLSPGRLGDSEVGNKGLAPNGEVPHDVPELNDVPPERWKRIDDYFDTLADIEDNKNVSRLPELAKQAKEMDLAPNKLEDDLRSSGIDEATIDKTLQQAYGPEMLRSQADESGGKISQLLRALSNDESGELQLSKKNWQQKFPQMMKNPTGLISRPMRVAHGAMSSTDQFLETNPVTKPIAEAARAAYFGPSGEQAFKSDVLNKFEDTFSQLKPAQLKDLHDVMEGAKSEDPQVMDAARETRAIFDYIHHFAESKGVTRASGKQMRYMSDYLTHIMKDDTFGGVATDYLKHLFGTGPESGLKERLFGEDIAPLKAGQGTNLGTHGLGNPRTEFAEARYGTEKPLESDMRTIARRYTESMGRAAFRGPVIKQAASIIDKMPPGPDKHFAEYYVQKYGGLTLDSPLSKIDKGLARMSARSLLAFSPKLQMLHAIRLVGQGIPELGFENVIKGAHSVLQDPNGAFQRAQRYGLIDNIPNKMKTGSEIFDKAANFADLGNNFTKVIMHEGNRAKLRDSSPDWETKAASETSRQEGMVNPTSPNYLLDKMPRIISQYKNYGQKYLENVVRSALQQDKAGYVKLGRYLGAGLGLTTLAGATGYALMHLRGRNMLSLSTPQLEFLNSLGQHLTSFTQEDKNGKTGLDKAVMDIIRFAIPGGHEFTRKDSEGELEFKPPSLSDEPNKTTEEVPY